jgi:hypothetical protein
MKRLFQSVLISTVILGSAVGVGSDKKLTCPGDDAIPRRTISLGAVRNHPPADWKPLAYFMWGASFENLLEGGLDGAFGDLGLFTLFLDEIMSAKGRLKRPEEHRLSKTLVEVDDRLGKGGDFDALMTRLVSRFQSGRVFPIYVGLSANDMSGLKDLERKIGGLPLPSEVQRLFPEAEKRSRLYVSPPSFQDSYRRYKNGDRGYLKIRFQEQFGMTETTSEKMAVIEKLILFRNEVEAYLSKVYEKRFGFIPTFGPLTEFPFNLKDREETYKDSLRDLLDETEVKVNPEAEIEDLKKSLSAYRELSTKEVEDWERFFLDEEFDLQHRTMPMVDPILISYHDSTLLEAHGKASADVWTVGEMGFYPFWVKSDDADLGGKKMPLSGSVSPITQVRRSLRVFLTYIHEIGHIYEISLGETGKRSLSTLFRKYRDNMNLQTLLKNLHLSLESENDAEAIAKYGVKNSHEFFVAYCFLPIYFPYPSSSLKTFLETLDRDFPDLAAFVRSL